MLETFAGVSVVILALVALSLIVIFGKQAFSAINHSLDQENVSRAAGWGVVIACFILLGPIVANALVNLAA